MPVAFQLEDVLPDVDFLGGDLLIKSGAAAGRTLPLTRIAGDTVLLGSTDPSVLVQIKPGDEVQVDNSNFLAAQTYHRHQVPGPEYHVWDQFRDPDGLPIYPQRPMLLGPLFTQAASGVVPSGRFKGKMIVLEALWDREAFPWQADWYRSKVKEHFGNSADEHFRLWYVDHALHGDFTEQEDPIHTVSYLGVLQQALRDLSAWVEKGVEPPVSRWRPPLPSPGQGPIFPPCGRCPTGRQTPTHPMPASRTLVECGWWSSRMAFGQEAISLQTTESHC